ncbi:MAG: S1C family serine protease [Candidatus Dormibacteria bacterium]
MNVSRVVAGVDPGVVDINSSNAYTGASDAGTGMILTSNGEVLTNNHVVAGGTTITAQVDGTGPKYRAKVVGTDPSQDVALLQLQGVSGLHPLKMGNSSAVRVGDAVVAIGNALALPGSPTVTEGIISALNRSITASNSGTGSSEHLVGLFQTDAPLSPGNSGGPLVNGAGQVIAMNTAAATGGGGQNASNIGFSIPINEALSIASQIQRGQASSTIAIGVPAFLGIEAENVGSVGGGGGFAGGPFGYTPPVSAGALVAAVIPNTPAVQAGLVPGDVITSFGGQAITSVRGLTTAIHADRPGQSVSVGWVTSTGTKQSATVRLASGPAA